MIHQCLEKILGAISYLRIESFIIDMDGEHENYVALKERKIVRVTNFMLNH